MNPALIQKYNQPGPRYTSYPPANHFRKDVDQNALTQYIQTAQNLSLYFHIPFCKSLCWFCGCCTTIAKRDQNDLYLTYLEREMDLLLSYKRTPSTVVQLHFGGGTPNFLEPHQILRLGKSIKDRFSFSSDAECSVELDPRSLTEKHIEAFYSIGINRASFGIQDCSESVQRAIHRYQPHSINEQAMRLLRKVGFGSISVDLIYGLPLQTPESFTFTLEKVLELNPNRIVTFNYAHLPQLKPAQKMLERTGLPSPQIKAQIFEKIITTLTDAGYHYIGMDHFAKTNDELTKAQKNKTLQRNFQGYSTREGVDIWGIGMSGISQTVEAYRQNVKELSRYFALLDKGLLPIERGYWLTKEDQWRRTLIMTLMCHLEIDFSVMKPELYEQTQKWLKAKEETLREMEADGLLTLDATKLKVTSMGRLLLRNIAMLFDGYLEAPGAYSQTV